MRLTALPYTVSALTDLIAQRLNSTPELQDITVEGELSNFRRYPSGHIYFTLKDKATQIPGVMFRGQIQGLQYRAQDGDQARVRGSVTVWRVGGKYQLQAERIEAAGEGQLQIAFERLKRELEAEGLFEEIHKRALPHYPERIGVVTSAVGAAVRDILNILSRRYPYAEVLIYPVLVQGTEAAGQIATAIRDFNRWDNVDVLIVGRGGGSIEDLWAFNEEIVVRSIFASHIPVVSAVGHETDTTLSDLVADRRAPTPSAAAELVVPDRIELQRHLRALSQQIGAQMRANLERARARWQAQAQQLDTERKLDELRQNQQWLDMLNARLERVMRGVQKTQMQRFRFIISHLERLSPQSRMLDARQQVARVTEQMERSIAQRLMERRVQLERALAQLSTLNPCEILRRGYSLCMDPSGAPIVAASQVSPGDLVQVRLAEGELTCHVLEISEEATHGTERIEF